VHAQADALVRVQAAVPVRARPALLDPVE
jgi:hypothetical protein